MDDERRWAILQHSVREHEIVQAFGALRSIDVEPILLKGWSVARHYQDPASRRLGDIDLLVKREHLAKARKAAGEAIDWHTENYEEYHQGSRLVDLQSAKIRVLCEEDNLRYVAIHMLKHAAWSQQWIQDVKVLLETRSAQFDWRRAEGTETESQWLRTALVVASNLAGADIKNTPAENHRIPHWVLQEIRKAQSRPHPEDNQPPESIRTALTHPWRLPQGLKARWPNKLTAAIETKSEITPGSQYKTKLKYCRDKFIRKEPI